MTTTYARLLPLSLLASLAASPAHAHDGPPFPIVSDRRAGAYLVSVWTDPDTTDDETAGGQFWVMLALAGRQEPVPGSTRVRITAIPLDREGPAVSTEATPVRNQPATQFGAVVLDHEGRFRVQVEIDGPAGPAVVDGEVDATYDLRPPPIMLVLYLLPFLAVGFLWAKLLIRRRIRRGPREGTEKREIRPPHPRLPPPPRHRACVVAAVRLASDAPGHDGERRSPSVASAHPAAGPDAHSADRPGVLVVPLGADLPPA